YYALGMFSIYLKFLNGWGSEFTLSFLKSFVVVVEALYFLSW
uniref:Uncharacterized protein n=1 Tax=Astyanax mexicanus TaxID=7994 RepID=A0A3B1K0J5_ASTMX